MNTKKTSDKKAKREPEYTLSDVGCYVDSARGTYAIDRIYQIAKAHGYVVEDLNGKPTEEGDDFDIGMFEDGCDDYMNNNFGVDGAYWGRSEQGDWGLWPIEED